MNIKKLFSEIERKENGNIDDILGKDGDSQMNLPTRIAMSALGVLALVFVLVES